MVWVILAPRAPNITSGEELVVYFVVIVSPIAACTAGGVIGVADGIRQTAVELGKVVVNKHERVVTYTTYAYDARNRLSLMRMYKVDDRKELVRTEFFYDDDSEVQRRSPSPGILRAPCRCCSKDLFCALSRELQYGKSLRKTPSPRRFSLPPHSVVVHISPCRLR
ncbi:MAG TPA: hypothetical protein VF888_03910 [Nitrospirota bacterium]